MDLYNNLQNMSQPYTNFAQEGAQGSTFEIDHFSLGQQEDSQIDQAVGKSILPRPSEDSLFYDDRSQQFDSNHIQEPIQALKSPIALHQEQVNIKMIMLIMTKTTPSWRQRSDKHGTDRKKQISLGHNFLSNYLTFVLKKFKALGITTFLSEKPEQINPLDIFRDKSAAIEKTSAWTLYPSKKQSSFNNDDLNLLFLDPQVSQKWWSKVPIKDSIDYLKKKYGDNKELCKEYVRRVLAVYGGLLKYSNPFCYEMTLEQQIKEIKTYCRKIREMTILFYIKHPDLCDRLDSQQQSEIQRFKANNNKLPSNESQIQRQFQRWISYMHNNNFWSKQLVKFIFQQNKFDSQKMSAPQYPFQMIKSPQIITQDQMQRYTCLRAVPVQKTIIQDQMERCVYLENVFNLPIRLIFLVQVFQKASKMQTNDFKERKLETIQQAITNLLKYLDSPDKKFDFGNKYHLNEEENKKIIDTIINYKKTFEIQMDQIFRKITLI